uniref:Na(+)-translocating NADH-quinone reductase subunit D n=2 Tax=Anthurium amnicola TaxID=1678845 RepID=A0A1D1Z2M7_9ARAE
MATLFSSRPVKLSGRSGHSRPCLRHRFHSYPCRRTPIPSSTSRRRPVLEACAELSGGAMAGTEGGGGGAEQERMGVEEWVAVLKTAAKTRQVAAAEVLAALSAIKKAEIDPSTFLEALGGSESPGRTWMLIFTAQGRLERGSYFPVTAVQRFDATARRIENGVYLGPLGCLTFEGRFSWKARKLAFIFECLRIKVGPFGPLQVSLGKQEVREPNTKDPFFIWFYVDEEIAVAQGKGGGTAFWCRCLRVT